MIIYWTTEGDTRGTCGHKHRTEAAADRCLAEDLLGCRLKGRYSDRSVVCRCEPATLPEMDRFRWLTGDVNWEDHGGSWYRRTGIGVYEVLRFDRWDTYSDEHRYNAGVVYTDVEWLNRPENASLLAEIEDEIQHAIAHWRNPPTRTQRELIAVDRMVSIGLYDRTSDRYGNNIKKVIKEAKEMSYY